MRILEYDTRFYPIYERSEFIKIYEPIFKLFNSFLEIVMMENYSKLYP